jgi:hypothetical protein
VAVQERFFPEKLQGGRNFMPLGAAGDREIRFMSFQLHQTSGIPLRRFFKQNGLNSS